MAVGLKYSATIVSYPRKELKRQVEHVVRRRKVLDPYFSISQYVAEAITEKLERDEETDTTPRQAPSHA